MTDPTDRANPKIVALLADCDNLLAYPDLTRRNAQPFTPAEVKLIGQAGIAELDAKTRLMAAGVEFAETKARDSSRLVEILSTAPAWQHGATTGDMLSQLGPVLRDEAEQITGRLFPDGYISFGPGANL